LPQLIGKARIQRRNLCHRVVELPPQIRASRRKHKIERLGVEIQQHLIAGYLACLRHDRQIVLLAAELFKKLRLPFRLPRICLNPVPLAQPGKVLFKGAVFDGPHNGSTERFVIPIAKPGIQLPADQPVAAAARRQFRKKQVFLRQQSAVRNFSEKVNFPFLQPCDALVQRSRHKGIIPVGILRNRLEIVILIPGGFSAAIQILQSVFGVPADTDNALFLCANRLRAKRSQHSAKQQQTNQPDYMCSHISFLSFFAK